MNRIKAHVKRHPRAYIVGGVCLAGITAIVMRKHIPVLQGGAEPILQGGVGELDVVQPRVFSLNFFSHNSGNSHTVATIHKGTKGHPGFLTRHVESGTVFENQSAAAKAFDVYPSLLSGHLNGKFPDVDGHHFERVSVLD